jgi:hypothetical protein
MLGQLSHMLRVAPEPSRAPESGLWSSWNGSEVLLEMRYNAGVVKWRHSTQVSFLSYAEIPE